MLQLVSGNMDRTEQLSSSGSLAQRLTPCRARGSPFMHVHVVTNLEVSQAPLFRVVMEVPFLVSDQVGGRWWWTQSRYSSQKAQLGLKVPTLESGDSPSVQQPPS